MLKERRSYGGETLGSGPADRLKEASLQPPSSLARERTSSNTSIWLADLGASEGGRRRSA